MIWFFICILTTAIVAGGFVVLVHARQTDGALKSFGRYLAIWIFVLAGLFFAGATAGAIHHGQRMMGPGMMGQGMMGRGMMGRGMMGHGMMERGMMERGEMNRGMMHGDHPEPDAPAPAQPPASPPATPDK